MQFIVDVGSGGNPASDANVLVEKFLDDGSQRGFNDIRVYEGQEIIQADAHDLSMFEDNEVDILIACHLLEHLENPNNALREWERVAKRGYIEVPNKRFDMFIRGREENHFWYCEKIGNGIRMTPRATVISLVPNNSMLTRLFRRLYHILGWKTSLCIWWEEHIPIRAKG